MGTNNQALRSFLFRLGFRGFLSILSGIFAGIAASVFLYCLEWATSYREDHMEIIWCLPLVGYFIGWMYDRFGKEIVGGNNLILEEIHSSKKILPFRMAPFIFFGTILTHLFGGSAGREGTAVQMGATFSDQISRLFRLGSMERRIFLIAGAGAGFSAAIGAPWAGAVFGMEVIAVGKLKLSHWWECLISSFVGFYTARMLHAPHSIFPQFEIPNFDIKIAFYVVLAGIFFGLTAKCFVVMSHFIEKWNLRLISSPPLRPFFSGIILVLLYYLEGTYRFSGLGIAYIQGALNNVASFDLPLLKMSFTAMTVGSGFKGGEFIPLVYVGTTLGSALSAIIPVSFQLLGGLGFAAVFAGASNTPIACSLMAMEIFGFGVGPYAFIACFVSFYFSGHHGIYKSQIIHAKKYRFFSRRRKV